VDALVQPRRVQQPVEGRIERVVKDEECVEAQGRPGGHQWERAQQQRRAPQEGVLDGGVHDERPPRGGRRPLPREEARVPPRPTVDAGVHEAEQGAVRHVGREVRGQHDQTVFFCNDIEKKRLDSIY